MLGRFGNEPFEGGKHPVHLSYYLFCEQTLHIDDAITIFWDNFNSLLDEVESPKIYSLNPKDVLLWVLLHVVWRTRLNTPIIWLLCRYSSPNLKVVIWNLAPAFFKTKGITLYM